MGVHAMYILVGNKENTHFILRSTSFILLKKEQSENPGHVEVWVECQLNQ